MQKATPSENHYISYTVEIVKFHLAYIRFGPSWALIFRVYLLDEINFILNTVGSYKVGFFPEYFVSYQVGIIENSQWEFSF